MRSKFIFLLFFFCSCNNNDSTLNSEVKIKAFNMIKLDERFTYYLDLLKIKKDESINDKIKFSENIGRIDFSFVNSDSINVVIGENSNFKKIIEDYSQRLVDEYMLRKLADKPIVIFIKEINCDLVSAEVYFGKCYSNRVYQGPYLSYLFCFSKGQFKMKFVGEGQVN